VTLNNTYIRNPGYTSTFSTQGTYTHTIKKISSNICQFRLDFDEFEIIKPNINTVANPNLPSDCPTDTLTVKEGLDKTSVNYPPVYCGIGTGMHMYLQAHPAENVDASIEISLGASTEARKWSIRVTQIECGKSWAPPPNCFQYLTGVSGTFKSFNYDDSNDVFTNSQMYGICLRREKNYCGYSVVPVNEPNSFSMGNYNNARGEDSCRIDYFAVPGGSESGRIYSTQRWCGLAFGHEVGTPAALVNIAYNNAMISYVTPFRMYVKSNDAHNGNNAIKGYKMAWRQLPCS